MPGKRKTTMRIERLRGAATLVILGCGDGAPPAAAIEKAADLTRTVG
jgi:hypothetical protein